MKEESIKTEKVFDTIKIGDLEEMSLDDKIIDSLMFSKCKYDANGVFTKWKSRLAARGDQQDASAYGGETSSPTANMTTINLILNFSGRSPNFLGWQIWYHTIRNNILQ